MNNALKIAAVAGSLLLGSCAPALQAATTAAAPGRLSVAQPAPDVTAGTLKLSSPQFADGAVLPMEQVGSGNGCTGMNVSPALNWSGAPAGTVSYVLTTYDPDAPTGSGFWHWVTFNIPATAAGLAKGAGSAGGTLPAGAVMLNNDGGTSGYTGACPPVGSAPHRYVFTLYALNRTLDLPAGVSPAYVGFNLNGSTLAKASITATYNR
ncbi:YbhB/YbcL family Raf kinase inhibitor-like protein [Deinococcus aquiradiocola]|uniref:Phosphatidylethanolamine-binding protein YbcL n=1 Tax=Deinococcus aquiradiocola TaxID=393059 RepID=A0A917P5K6_9DEIO|nr:YbhB/YbcL family Raf kinase inhibitor-like protein [Deinococcus aquiradiocola]GGJ62680.1 phosphatidylethanolamine-binding protein YbcL [Deinococcus aquiradiocola]